jgi:hypothetical protein
MRGEDGHIISMSQIHATDTNGHGQWLEDVSKTVTSGVNGAGEAPFQVLSPVPCRSNPTVDNSYIQSSGG